MITGKIYLYDGSTAFTTPPTHGQLTAERVLLRFAGGTDQASAVLAGMKRKGILLRGLAGYGLPDCLRVTIGTEEEMRATAEALGDAMP